MAVFIAGRLLRGRYFSPAASSPPPWWPVHEVEFSAIDRMELGPKMFAGLSFAAINRLNTCYDQYEMRVGSVARAVAAGQELFAVQLLAAKLAMKIAGARLDELAGRLSVHTAEESTRLIGLDICIGDLLSLLRSVEITVPVRLYSVCVHAPGSLTRLEDDGFGG